MKLHLITVVWGDAYTRLFLDVILPTQLSPGNLPAIAGAPGHVYVIYTTSNQLQLMRSHPAIAHLATLLSVDIRLIDNTDFQRSNKYGIMAACHRHAIVNANEQNAAMVFLSPDAILADGAFAHLLLAASQGKRAVMICGLRLNRDTFVPAFTRRFVAQQRQAVIARPRELFTLALEHLHPYTQSLFWHSKDYNRTPSVLLWSVPERGLLARAFHLHPLFIHPVRRDVLPQRTVDCDYIAAACPDVSQLQVIEDSDQVLCVELSPGNDETLMQHIKSDGSVSLLGFRSQQPAPDGSTLKAVAVAHWAVTATDAHHRAFFSRHIRMHAGNLTEDWFAIRRESDHIAAQIEYWLVREPTSVLRSTIGRAEQLVQPAQ